MHKIFFILSVLSSQIVSAQNNWYVNPAISSQFTNPAFFFDVIKENKKHDFYFGIGIHLNTTKEDVDGTGYLNYHQRQPYTLAQSFLFKVGYRKYIGKQYHAQFYPYSELVFARMGYYGNSYFGAGPNQQLRIIVQGSEPTSFLMLNLGIGVSIPFNEKISLLAQGGITPTVSFENNFPSYESIMTENWQIGFKIKL